MPETAQIFEEPHEDIDETWTHGSMLGGMAGYDNESLAGSYISAGHHLVEAVLSTGESAQQLICPVLFVYRHGVELYLKVLTSPKKLSHRIPAMLNMFVNRVRTEHGEQVPQWFTRPILELAQFDPASDAFRYGTDRNGRNSFKSQGELWVDLPKLRKTMAAIQFGFQRVLVADRTSRADVNSVGPRRPAYE